MKAFQYFLTTIEVIIFVCILLLAFGFVNEFPGYLPNQSSKLGIFTSTNSDSVSDSSTKQVSIYDQGIQMMRGTYTIPSDWLMQQNVYTSPYSYDYYTSRDKDSASNRFLVSFNGLQGEIIRCQEHYGNYQWGKANNVEDFRSEVDSLCRVGLLSHLNNLSIGEFSANNPTEARYLSNYVKVDSMYQYLEASFTGKFDGEDFEGIVRVLYPNLASAVNLVSVSVILSPPSTLSRVMEIENQIAFSYRANPAFEQHWLNSRRWHHQYIDQIGNDYIPERPGWHPDSAYYDPKDRWGEYQNWEKVTPSY